MSDSNNDDLDRVCTHRASDNTNVTSIVDAFSGADSFFKPQKQKFNTDDYDDILDFKELNSGSRLNLLRASDLKPQAVDWIWEGWLASGKVHIFGGAPGTGKTTISMSLAATLTNGGLWPDGSKAPTGNVVIWSGEDDPVDTLLPRLLLSGADQSKIYFAADIVEGDESRPFDPSKDLMALKQKILEIGDVRLLIVDPVVSAIAGDSNKNAEVRRDLQPLADLAKELHCALLGITHFSKGTSGRDPVERLTGSVAFGAIARVVMVAAKSLNTGTHNSSARIFCRAKSNVGVDGDGFEYVIKESDLASHEGITSSFVKWGLPLHGSAVDLLSTAEETLNSDKREVLSEAKLLVTTLLSSGPVQSSEVFKECDLAGYSKRTVQRAASTLGVIRKKSGLHAGWQWSLPPKVPEEAEDAS
jgi:putative DNA primase/helicase